MPVEYVAVPTFEGFLEKQAKVTGRWKRYWFVLDSDQLSYFKDQERKCAQGLIDLGQADGVHVSTSSTYCYPFEIVTKQRTHVLSVGTAELRDKWLRVLKQAQLLSWRRSFSMQRPSCNSITEDEVPEGVLEDLSSGLWRKVPSYYKRNAASCYSSIGSSDDLQRAAVNESIKRDSMGNRSRSLGDDLSLTESKSLQRPHTASPSRIKRSVLHTQSNIKYVESAYIPPKAKVRLAQSRSVNIFRQPSVTSDEEVFTETSSSESSPEVATKTDHVQGGCSDTQLSPALESRATEHEEPPSGTVSIHLTPPDGSTESSSNLDENCNSVLNMSQPFVATVIPALPHPRLELTFRSSFDDIRSFLAMNRGPDEIFPVPRKSERGGKAIKKLRDFLIELG